MIKNTTLCVYMIRFVVWILQSRPLIRLTTATTSAIGGACDMPGSAS
jgi:hypothetical protein